MDKKAITLKEWADFNADIHNYGDWIVCLMKNGSYNKDNTILECTISTEYAVKLFWELGNEKVYDWNIPRNRI